MPGDTIYMTSLSARSEISRPVGTVSNWITVIDPGGLELVDGTPITIPSFDITNVTRRPLNVAGAGTNLIVRIGYDLALSTITNPFIKVFGRSGTDEWQILEARSGLISVEIPTDTVNDVNDGLQFAYTTPSYTSTSWDLLGCNEILIGVEVALSGLGDASTAFLQAKII